MATSSTAQLGPFTQDECDTCGASNPAIRIYTDSNGEPDLLFCSRACMKEHYAAFEEAEEDTRNGRTIDADEFFVQLDRETVEV